MYNILTLMSMVLCFQDFNQSSNKEFKRKDMKIFIMGKQIYSKNNLLTTDRQSGYDTFSLDTNNKIYLSDKVLGFQRKKGIPYAFFRNRTSSKFTMISYNGCDRIKYESFCITLVNSDVGEEISVLECSVDDIDSQCVFAEIEKSEEEKKMQMEELSLPKDTIIPVMTTSKVTYSLNKTTQRGNPGMNDQFVAFPKEYGAVFDYTNQNSNQKEKDGKKNSGTNQQTKNLSGNMHKNKTQSEADEQEEDGTSASPFAGVSPFNEKGYDLSVVQKSLDDAFHDVIGAKTEIQMNQKRFIPGCYYGYQSMQEFLRDPLPNFRKMRRKYCYDLVVNIE